MFQYQVNDHLTLRRLAIEDAPALFKLVSDNRAALQQWLPWATKLTTIADEEQFIQATLTNVMANEELVFTILVDQQVAGLVELHEISGLNHHAGVGYWLGADYQGRGVMRAAVEQLVKIGFQELHLQRIELIAAVENQASRAVAEHTKFQLEGILRADLALLDGFHDAACYSRLVTD